MSIATFATNPTQVPVYGHTGTMNGYKVLSVYHGGRKIGLERNKYYYIPHINALVSLRGSVATKMTLSQEGTKYSLIEKFVDRPGHWNFKIDSHFFHEAAASAFRSYK